MKIQCDVCDKEEALVYCTADEAALCHGCDHRVHHVNKLASKHKRFSLLSPSPKQLPLCEICQEKRAFLFCQQDRAILCKDCDGPIHSANELTKKHDRFLLTGVKLSATSSLYTLAAATADDSDVVPDFRSGKVNASEQQKTAEKRSDFAAGNGVSSTSSISEYLMETLPGWHFEDFCDSFSPSVGSYKSDESLLSLTEDSLGMWVPQHDQAPIYSSAMESMNTGLLKETMHMKLQCNKRWSENDDVFAVPEITPPSTVRFKRSRYFY